MPKYLGSARWTGPRSSNFSILPATQRVRSLSTWFRYPFSCWQDAAACRTRGRRSVWATRSCSCERLRIWRVQFGGSQRESLSLVWWHNQDHIVVIKVVFANLPFRFVRITGCLNLNHQVYWHIIRMCQLGNSLLLAIACLSNSCAEFSLQMAYCHNCHNLLCWLCSLSEKFFFGIVESIVYANNPDLKDYGALQDGFKFSNTYVLPNMFWGSEATFGALQKKNQPVALCI